MTRKACIEAARIEALARNVILAIVKSADEVRSYEDEGYQGPYAFCPADKVALMFPKGRVDCLIQPTTIVRRPASSGI